MERSVQETGNLPILKNILFKTDSGKVLISATNLEFATTTIVPGKVNSEGLVAAPFNALYKIVNNSDSERITLELEKGSLNVKTDNYQAVIQLANPDDFPIIPKIKSPNRSIKINPAVFKSAILKIISAAQISEIRPEISGVLVDYQITMIKFVATDTFRLGEKTITENQYKGSADEGFKAIIPLKTIQEVVRIFNDSAGDIEITFDDHQVLFKNESVELISRLIDGEYPDYQAIIPKTIATEIVVNRGQLINAIKLVSGFSGKVNEIKIRLLENNKTLEVYSASQNVGENRYLLPVKCEGENVEEIAFNWRYLNDGLRSLESESVIFGVNGDNRPAILKSADDQSFFYILMPIKI